jgi:phosphoribosylformylglycinamidine synthase
VTLHTHILEGGNALSAFRTQQLLSQLQALCPDISGLQGQFVHLVASETAISSAQTEILQQLLTYGDPAVSLPSAHHVLNVIVSPRLGTVSPGLPKRPTSPTTVVWQFAELSA